MKQAVFKSLFLVDIHILCLVGLRFVEMLYATMEGLRTVLSSITFGMDDKYDRLVRKHTVFIVLLGEKIRFYLHLMYRYV